MLLYLLVLILLCTVHGWGLLTMHGYSHQILFHLTLTYNTLSYFYEIILQFYVKYWWICFFSRCDFPVLKGIFLTKYCGDFRHWVSSLCYCERESLTGCLHLSCLSFDEAWYGRGNILRKWTSDSKCWIGWLLILSHLAGKDRVLPAKDNKKDVKKVCSTTKNCICMYTWSHTEIFLHFLAI